ncbi:MAG: DsbA family protein [Armatimonadota bacterium]|nr:DsbA family protein [Armatimonadota bacterium]MDR7443945.1 DsbA family protein [Armatimonadota bacterium]MDR7570043.1 DsbA family protein [Armatimonadota bacterium]MDR7615452.1 DsbA family protein [Armatimonadota bacterium]
MIRLEFFHRINADLMATRPFDYPYSMPGLKACKAAEFQGGHAAHWDMFDRVQRAHLTECLNIADFEVLRQCAADVGLDEEVTKECPSAHPRVPCYPSGKGGF